MLREKCGYTGTQPYWDWTLGMISACDFHIAELINFGTDVSNFQDSTFWDPDATSGVGGWGDPNDDYQITSGGFAKDFIVSYPVPHRIRRQYTPVVPGGPAAPLTKAFTPESQVAMVNGFEGSFVGFQAEFESGSHKAVHAIVAGCVNLLPALWFCPLKGPTQRSFRGLSIKRSC